MKPKKSKWLYVSTVALFTVLSFSSCNRNEKFTPVESSTYTSVYVDEKEYVQHAETAEGETLEEKVKRIQGASIGSTITYGIYEQNNNLSDGKEEIEWIVLSKEDGRVLVISKYALDCQQFHFEDEENITWEECSLRTWLNGTFLNEAFTEAEINYIPLSKVKQEMLSGPYEKAAGKDTMDQIFLLNLTEAQEYFDSDDNRKCMPTEYAGARGANRYQWNGEIREEPWWLRTAFADMAMIISEKGAKQYADRDHTHIAVRPAMWIGNDETAYEKSLQATYNQVEVDWNDYEFEITDGNGYQFLVTLKLTPLCSVSSHLDYIRIAWDEVDPGKELPTGIGDWGFNKTAVSDMYYSVGRISIINKTPGWDITANAPVKFNFEIKGSMDANYKFFFTPVKTERGALKFAVSLKENRSGVSVIICHPENYTPKYPGGEVRHRWEDHGQLSILLQWINAGSFSLPYLEN